MVGKEEVKRMKKILSFVLACMLAVSCFTANANAFSADSAGPELSMVDILVTRASGSFSVSVSAGSIVGDRRELSLSKGETVQITATYSPSGSVDFGLIDSDGVFHYVNATNGSIDKSIEITKSGTYIFAVRNNSSREVKVSGYLRY